MAGKEYTLVVLSSSPPALDAFSSPRHAAPARRVAMPPSSPYASSPPTSPRKHTSGALTSGSRAAPITEKAARGFATVSSLVRSEHFAQQSDDGLVDVHQAPLRRVSPEGDGEVSVLAKKPKKRTTKNATGADGEKPKPKPKPRGRKPKADKELEVNNTTFEPELLIPPSRNSPVFKNAEAQTTIETPAEPAVDALKLTKSGKPRKLRAKKEKVENGDTAPKPRNIRVTKPRAAAKACKASREDADVVSNHFSVDKGQANTTSNPACLNNAQAESIWDLPQSPPVEKKAAKRKSSDLILEGLELDEAVSRRRVWTPPRDTVTQSPATGSTGKENRPMAPGAGNGAFTSLVTNFTYESPTVNVANNATVPKEPVSGVTKRRRVELVELPGVQTISRASPTGKGKAPRKKPRTITDLVTGQYAPKDLLMDAQAVTSDFFSPLTSTTKVPLNDVALDSESPPKKALRKRSKSREGSEDATTKAKPRARKASSKPAAKPKPVVEKLLSPTSAAMHLNQQDVLFGTSSQLALEESPATLRQIQQAITESELNVDGAPDYLLEAPPRWLKLQRVEGKRGLWRESTRDSEGGLLENEENVYIPKPDRTQYLPLLMDVAHEEANQLSDFVDIDDLKPAVDFAAPIGISSDLPTPPESQSPKSLIEPTPTRLARDEIFEDIDDFENSLPPSNQNAGSPASFADIDDFQSAPPSVEQKPASETSRPPPSASVQVPSSGSSKKRRGRPPKAQSAIPTVPASVSRTSHKLASPRRTQRILSTPPKGSGRFIDIEEILDSEEEVLEAFSPTPPRVRKLQNSPPLPMAFDREVSKMLPDDHVPTPIFRILTSQLEWANIKPAICSAITAHIGSIPPTTDPKKPSWHEKILMYDPIILEDLTAYLNSETKLRTYRHATQKQVKAYNNELKNKGNAILGVERDDEVLVIEKELEVYMVRDWCEQMSICCIHAKESRGRGSARKGFY